MKVTVRNLGVVKNAEIDLKPLTIFIGPNNSGKTWLAYTIAAALGHYGWNRYLNAYVTSKTPEKYRKLDALAKQISDSGDGVLDIVQFADEYGEKCVNDILSFAKTWMRRFLGTDRAKFDSLYIQADIVELKGKLLQHLQNIEIEDRIGGAEEMALLKALKEPGDNKIFFYPGQNIKNRLPLREIRRFVVSIVLREILRFFYPTIHFFPTERTSIIADQFITLPTTGLLEKLAQSSKDLTDILPEPRPRPEPTNSFASMIAWMYGNASTADREEQALNEGDGSVREYMQLAEILQERILEGGVDFSTPDPDPRREILFQPDRHLEGETPEIELSIASSMVKELSSLVLYLRYLAESGELLIIDEPEMNLHPAAQVKLIEFLAMMVNAGLHVLITTHSPYVTDHLVNLIEAYKHNNHDEVVKKFLLQRVDSLIEQSKVSVYSFEDGDVTNVLKPDGSINWHTFSDVTGLVEQINFEL